MNKKLRWWQAALIIIISVSAAGVMTKFISMDFSSLEIFAPIEKKIDFQVSDIYNAVEEDKQGGLLSQEVLVVNVDSFNREGTMAVVEQVAAYGAKAIGLDIFFPVSKNDSSNDYLVDIMKQTPNLVCACKVVPKDSTGLFTREDISFYESYYEPAHKGFVNLDIKHSWNVVRTFHPYVWMTDGKQTASMALALAQLAAPEQAEKLLARGEAPQIIDFTSREIEVIDAQDLDELSVAERINGKVVLVGGMSDNKDIYLTPLHQPTQGVMVHAHALQTILDESYIETRAEWKNWTIAICICLLLVSILLFANQYEPLKYVLNITVRLLLFVIMYLLVVHGCHVFANTHVYADYTPAILMLGFGTLAFDITYATYGLIRQIYTKRNQNKTHQ